MNPEFLSEGRAVEDFTKPDRIVIGASTARAGAVLADIYAKFNCPILQTTPRNAEMVKYAANALQATLISFSNEIAGICESVSGLDEETVMRGVHLDKCWGAPRPRWQVAALPAPSRISEPALALVGAAFRRI